MMRRKNVYLSVMSNWDRVEITELRSFLSDPDVQKNPTLYQKAVQKVVGAMTLGIDVSSLFSEMIKAGSTYNLVQKKLVYLYLGNYAETNSDLALMTINTLQKDFQDRNRMLRGLALRSLCSLRCLPDIVKYLREPLQLGLRDASPYVRKTAVMGVVKLFYIDPNAVDEMNFVDILYQMLRDRDPQVVSNCIAALTELLASEGGMVVNTKIAHYLLNRLHEFSEWGQCQILDLLTRYQPLSEDEVYDILTILDDRLKHANCGVVLGAIHLFISLTENMPHLLKDVYKRIRTPMLTFVCIDYVELSYIYLSHAKILLAKNPQMWRQDYKSFYCRYTDPHHVKVKKIEILSEICMFENAQQIMDELSMYATDVNALVARNAIQAMGSIALRLPARANKCSDKLVSLLGFNIDYVTSETLVTMTSILRKFDNMLEAVLPKLSLTCVTHSDPEGKAAFIWIIGEYGEFVPNAPYILEEMVNSVSDESSSGVKLQLLSAVMKLFFKRPPECQGMLGRLLDYVINEENDQDVKDRAMLYYRLLKADLKMAKRVVCGQIKLVSEENPASARFLLLPEFNTLSIMFEKPSKEFISQKYPYILSHESDSSGGEVNFEKELIHCGESNNLLRRQDSVLTIPLNPEVTISAADFELKWNELHITKEMYVYLKTVPSPRDFKKALASRHIMTMASSPPDQSIIKYFFYAQHVSTSHFFLVEVNIAVSNAMLSFTLKCENTKQASGFVKHFFQSLGLSSQPSPLLQWKTCSDIPAGMKNAFGVFYNGQLHVGGGCTGNPRADSTVYAYSPDVDMWKVLPPCPVKWFGMTVWNDQLVLLGGKEENSKKAVMTNKLVTWENGKWEFSLPPMLVARVSPIAMSYEKYQPKYLVVAGGRRGYLGYSVEVLDSTSMQWHHMPSLPISCQPHTTMVCGNHLYLMQQKMGKILHTDIANFMKQKEEFKTESMSMEDLSDSGESHSGESISSDSYETEVSPIWQQIPKPPVQPLRITTVGGYVVVFSHGSSGDGNFTVHAYFPETNSWYQIGKLPGISSSMSISCIASPEKKLYIIGGDSIHTQYSQKIIRVAIKVPTETDSQSC